MKTRIARYLFTAVGFAGLAGTPALFAGDPGRDYHHLAHENADIRGDRRRLLEDLERGRYHDAARTRADLKRDYYRRDRQLRDIHRDERFRGGQR
jgi:hypothetical protein